MRVIAAPGTLPRTVALRVFAPVAAVLALSGCASQADSDLVACPEVRPQVCTLEYAPTCGVDEAGVRQEFSSPCNACASEGIAGYEPGPCAE